ncbi:MAG: CapA family protein [Candidatus Cryptobacteroides sp.]
MWKPLKYSLCLLLSCCPLFLKGQDSSRADGIHNLPPPIPLAFGPDTVSISFLGDAMMHKGQIDNALREDGSYCFSEYFQEINHLTRDADLAVANLEFTLAGPPYSGYPCFSAPYEYADELRRSGIDVFLTANNHILDKGDAGMLRTLRHYDGMASEGIFYTGCAADGDSDLRHNPLFLSVKGVRIALVNFTYGTNVPLQEGKAVVHRIDTVWLSQAIGRARDARVDFVIALPHWGTEYSLRCSRAQKELASWLAEKGCDAVIGAHPHVPQNIETITVTRPDGGVKKVPVVYSLGNLVSNMSAPNTRVGLVATLRIAIGHDGSRSLLPLETVFTWCTRPGTLTQGYCVIPLKEYIGRREEWIAPYDYDNMIDNYRRVKLITQIEE